MGMGDDHDSIGVWGGVVKYWAWYWVWYGVADTAWHGMVFDKAWCVDGMMRVEADGGGSREGEVDRRQQNQNRGINHQ
ncbi:hypothetical protein H4I96_06439 [Botrytis cinerea]